MSDSSSGADSTAVVDRTLVSVPGADATVAMPGVSAGADPMRTQLGGTAACPVCHTMTSSLDPYCGECGYLLSSPQQGDIEVPQADTPAGELLDTNTGRRFDLKEGANTIGRQGTDVLSTEGTVSRVHAKITVTAGTAVVEDMGSSNGTKVGDVRVSPGQQVPAASGTTVRFGSWTVVLELSQPADGAVAHPTIDLSAQKEQPETAELALVEEAEPASPVIGTLVLLEGLSRDIPIREGVVSIGRKPENSVMITGDRYVSGFHAEVAVTPDGIHLTDVGSTNGTVVNGVKIDERTQQQLVAGDEVQIGQSRFRFEVPTEPAMQVDTPDAEDIVHDPDATPDSSKDIV